MKLYFTLKELNPKNYHLTKEVESNLNKLIEKISVIREKYGKPLIISSGLRSIEDQQRINPKASKSAHLSGEACDISDPKGELKQFIKDNISLVEDLGLYFEDFSATSVWIHIQIRKPKSGKRFFLP